MRALGCTVVELDLVLFHPILNIENFSTNQKPEPEVGTCSLPSARILNAMRTVPGMNLTEVDRFLSDSKIILRLGTTDDKNDPIIHPVWYYYLKGKLYFLSYRNTLKVRNINRRNTVYFSVDTEATPNEPNKGVKGKGTATIVRDSGRSLSITEKIVAKYLGDPNAGLGKGIVDAARKGSQILVEITPKYFSTWDYGKMKI